MGDKRTTGTRTLATGGEQGRADGEEDGGPRAALVWQARAQIDLAVLIERYLTEHPPPAGATHHLDYHDWTRRMDRAGRCVLEELRARRLRSV